MKIITGKNRTKLRQLKAILQKTVAPVIHFRSWQQYRNTIFLIYTMGKVGTHTIHNSLRSQLPASSILFAHYLSDRWLDDLLPRYMQQYSLDLDGVRRSKEVRRYLQKHSKKDLRIITLVREPVMRDISLLFQSWKYIYGQRPAEEVPVEEIIAFLDDPDWPIPDNWYTTRWLNNEFKEFLGFDVYAHPFDKERGYHIYEWNDARILLIKLERLDSCFREAFQKFAGLDLVQLQHSNRSQKKRPLKELYRMVKQHYTLDEAQLEARYHSKYVRHFYTEEEIASFKKRWGRVEV